MCCGRRRRCWTSSAAHLLPCGPQVSLNFPVSLRCSKAMRTLKKVPEIIQPQPHYGQSVTANYFWMAKRVYVICLLRTGTRWSFKNSAKVYGSPMLDAALRATRAAAAAAAAPPCSGGPQWLHPIKHIIQWIDEGNCDLQELKIDQSDDPPENL